MSVRVLLPNAFQKHTNNVREISSAAANLPELVTEIEGRFPALRQHLRGEDGQIRRFINFYVNEEDIRFLGNEKYSFKEGDEVLVIPSIAGGLLAKLRTSRCYQGSPSGGPFYYRPSYSTNKVFAPYLHHLHYPLTIPGGYYSRDYARWAEGSIAGSTQAVEIPRTPLFSCLPLRSRKAAHPRGSREVPAAPRTDRGRPRSRMPSSFQGLQYRNGRGSGELLPDRSGYR